MAYWATRTVGFSGADLANLANEAAILAVRKNETVIDRTTLIDAFEKITIGLPYNSNTIDVEEVKLVSHHEVGHAMMTKFFEEFFDLIANECDKYYPAFQIYLQKHNDPVFALKSALLETVGEA